MTDDNGTDTQAATDDPPTTAAPLAFKVTDWLFGAYGPWLRFDVGAGYDELDTRRREAGGEFVRVLQAVQDGYARGAAEHQAVKDARAAAELNGQMVADAARALPALEAEHAAAVRDPRKWPKLDALERDVETARDKVRRLKARQPLLARAVEQAEAAAVEGLRAVLTRALADYRAAAEVRLNAAVANLSAVASPAVLELVLSMAARPQLNDPAAVINGMLPHPTANRPVAPVDTDESADALAAVGEE